MEFNKLFYIENNNAFIHVKHFKKQKNYKLLIEYLLKIISEAIIHNQSINAYIYMNDAKSSEIDIPLARNLADILTNLFPNILGTCYIINFPSYLKNIYKIVCTFIDKDVRSKIIFMKQNSNKMTMIETPD